MADVREWKEAEQRILDALDIALEYKTLGVVFTRDHPTQKGWLACHAIDRKDNAASAAVFVGNGASRGRYRDMGGDGLSLNLWEFAAKFGSFGGDWKEARKQYARRTGVSLPGGGEPKRPADQVDFLDTPAGDSILDAWAGLKGGFDLQTVRECGGRYGRYPKKARPEGSQYVAAFPGYNPPGLCDSDPLAWVIANTTGHPITLYRGQGKPPTESKTLSVGGSVGSLLGAWSLLHLEDAEFVWKCEGLTDLLTFHHALREAGLLGRHVVISNSQGSLESVKPEWVQMLAGKKVRIVQDCDRPGQTGAVRWCQALCETALEVKNVVLPYAIKEAHGEDLRDFLFRDKRPVGELLELAEKAAPYRPEDLRAAQAAHSAAWAAAPSGSPGQAAAQAGLFDGEDAPAPARPALAGGVPGQASSSEMRRAALDNVGLVGIDVLGEYDDEQIDIYSRFRRKVCRIKDIDRHSYRKLIQQVGESALIHVHDGKDQVEGKVTMEEVRRAISLLSSDVNLSEVGTLGQGVWPAGLDAPGKLVLVNGGEAGLYDPARNELGRITTPRLGGQTIIDFTATRPWADFDALRGLLAQAADDGWCRSVLEEARAIFALWNWKHPQDAWTTPLLVACTFVQTVWPWRPEVAVTGPSDCGKSTLLGVLKALFGRLSFYSSKPTEAGIRQRVRNNACAIMVDEFESDSKRQAVLELFRTTSQGGELVRGSSDQKGRTFGLKHIPWMAAIESGLTKAADRNRFIILDLQALPRSVRGRAAMPGELALGELGQRLCAVAMRHCGRAVELFRHLKGQSFEGVHGRVVESFSTPAALKAAIDGRDEAGSVEVLAALLAGRTSIARQGGGDEADLMKAILDSTFQVGSGQPPLAVSEAVTDEEAYMANIKTLESVGVTMTDGCRSGPRLPQLAGKQFIFFDVEKVRRYLLKGTPWASMDCEQLLLRLPGAARHQRMVSGSRPWGIEVPIRDWVQARRPEEKAENYLPLDPEPAAADEPPPEPAPTPPGPPAGPEAPGGPGGPDDVERRLKEAGL